jgi:radical SAM protein with 4Fe4S-binding SPASM domain
MHVVFAVTYACNARCTHCSIAARSAPAPGEMDTATVQGVLEQMADAGVLFVGLTGGEALLRPDIYRLIEVCRRLQMFVSVATNGLLLTPDTVARLRAAGADGLLVSVDHVDPALHDIIRGIPGLFQAACDGIRRAVAAGLQVTLGFTPMRPNRDVLAETAALALGLGCAAINYSQYMPSGRGSRQLDLAPHEWEELTWQVIELERAYRDRLRVQYHDPRLYLLDPDIPGLPGGPAPCQAGQTHCYILPDGNVTPCNMILGMVIGNVKEEPLCSILARYQATSRLQDRSLLKGSCGRCSHKHECGGCRATALLYAGDALGGDPRCWVGPRRGVAERAG